MPHIDTQYEDLLRRVRQHGIPKTDRTGTGTLSVFAERLRYNLADGFPLITTKRVHFKSILVELLWFLRGDTNIRWLHQHGVTIWDEWADPNGDLGPIYGHQWRHWPTPDGGSIDQLQQVLDLLRRDPDSRRLLVSAWNVADLNKMALPPCHVLFQFHVAGDRLSCQVYQRSADLFLGVPFNLASYALLTHLVAQQTGYEPGELIWVGGDCHIYRNHLHQVDTQLARPAFPFPRIEITPAPSLFDYTPEHIRLVGYHHHPAIPAPVAV